MTYDIEHFRKELGRQVEHLRERSLNYRLAKRYGQITETPKKIRFYFETKEIDD